MPESNFKYQSNDNYPWEHEGNPDVWVTDFSMTVKETLRQETTKPIEKQPAITQEEKAEILGTQKIEDIFSQSLADRKTEDRKTDQVELKPVEKHFSWILAAVILLIIVVAGEIALRDLSRQFFWAENILLLSIWLWRLCLLIFWLYLAQGKWRLYTEKVYAATISAFFFGVIVSAVWKIVVIKSVWVWLNLLIEPIWMILIVALVGSLLTKLIFSSRG